MVSGNGVHIEGLRDVVRSLERMGVEASDLKEAFTRIGQKVATEAKSQVPTVSGRLAASIKPSKTKNKAVVRAGSARVPYAGVQNYGWPTRGIKATQFLTGPADANADDAVQMLEHELGQLIARLNLK